MGACLAQSTPERLVRRRLAAAVAPESRVDGSHESRVDGSHESLVDGGDHGLVCGGLRIAVGVENVFRVAGVRVPAGAPREPDAEHAGSLGPVGEDRLPWGGLPPGVFLADVGERPDVAGFVGVATFRAGGMRGDPLRLGEFLCL